MLNDKQLKAIEMLVVGDNTKTKIAKEVGIERGTLYDWLEKDEFIKELDKRTHKYKISVQKEADRKLLNITNYALDELVSMSKECDNSETKRKILVEILDRTLGKVATNQNITINEDDNSKADIDNYYDNISTEE